MAMYCTLQEAYNQPSFSKPRKMPSQGNMQCAQINTPHATNLYTNQNGNEQVAYTQSHRPRQSQKNQQNQQNQQPPRQIQTPNMVEEFMTGGVAAVIPNGYNGILSKQLDPVQGNVPYAAQGNDYKYYCDNMGICPSAPISIEGFTDNYGSENYLEPGNHNMHMAKQKSYQSANQLAKLPAQPTNVEYTTNDGLPENASPYDTMKNTPNAQKNCKMSDDATMYKYPISDSTKKQFDMAMNTYVSDVRQGPGNLTQSNTPRNSPNKSPSYSMNNVAGLYDDEISQYMRIQDMGLPYSNATTNVYDNPYSIADLQQVTKLSTPSNVPMSSEDYHTLSSSSEFMPANYDNYSLKDLPKSNTPYSPQPLTPSKANMSQTSPKQIQNVSQPNCATNQDLTSINENLAYINKYLANLSEHLPNMNASASASASAATPVKATFAVSTTPENEAQNTPKASTMPANKWQYIMDVALFIAAGILIIILCDLLFKIAYSIGMKDSFTMMQPYLSEIDELKEKIKELLDKDN